MKIKAAVVRGTKKLSIETLELEDPRPDEVIVRILSSGICRTDLEVLDGKLPFVPSPIILGHEGAGIVERVGANVTSVAPGDTVVLCCSACGVCHPCRAGQLPYCDHHIEMNFLGKRLDGTTAFTDEQGDDVHGHFFSQSSWSNYAVSHWSNTIKVAADVDPEILGPFGCGIMTGAGSVLNLLKVEAGTSIAVFGLGAVGLSAIMAANVAGAAVIIAVGRHDDQLALAKEIGATHLVNSDEVDPLDAIRKIGGGKGVNYSVEATGAPGVMRLAVDCLIETGHAAITGVAAGQTFELDVWTVLRGRTVHGTTLGDAVPALLLPRLVELFKQGRFPVDKIMTHYPMADIERAIADVDAGRVAKAVLHP